MEQDATSRGSTRVKLLLSRDSDHDEDDVKVVPTAEQEVEPEAIFLGT